jgi:hypothetical protein
MKKLNITKPEKYTKDGVEKTYWANVGTITIFDKEDGSQSYIVEIPAIGLKANAFPIEKKVERPAMSDANDEINPDSIPF